MLVFTTLFAIRDLENEKDALTKRWTYGSSPIDNALIHWRPNFISVEHVKSFKSTHGNIQPSDSRSVKKPLHEFYIRSQSTGAKVLLAILIDKVTKPWYNGQHPD